jgi:hypothetical protein
MLASNILGHTSKHCQSKTFLNELVSIDTWSKGLKNLVSDVRLLGKLSNLSFILISELNDLLITKSLDIIGLNNGIEYRESMLHISTILKSIDEYTCNLYLVTRSGAINQIIQDVNLLLSWDSTWWHRSWSLLNCPFLIVAIYTHEVIELKFVVGANSTASKELLDVLITVVIVRTLEILTTCASIV